MAQAPEFKDFLPGLEFFQTFLKGAGMPSNFANWVAPTLDVEELDQKISDLKAVLSWLEANARMTQSMIQGLEVQRMTLATLKTMNVDMQGFAERFGQDTASDAGSGSAAAATSAPDGEANGFEPMQWWTSITQQFSDLATRALQDGQGIAAGFSQSMADAAKSMQAADAKPAAKAPAKKTPAAKTAKPKRKAPARKSAARKTAAKSAAKTAAPTRRR